MTRADILTDVKFIAAMVVLGFVIAGLWSVPYDPVGLAIAVGFILRGART